MKPWLALKTYAKLIVLTGIICIFAISDACAKPKTNATISAYKSAAASNPQTIANIQAPTKINNASFTFKPLAIASKSFPKIEFPTTEFPIIVNTKNPLFNTHKQRYSQRNNPRTSALKDVFSLLNAYKSDNSFSKTFVNSTLTETRSYANLMSRYRRISPFESTHTIGSMHFINNRVADIRNSLPDRQAGSANIRRYSQRNNLRTSALKDTFSSNPFKYMRNLSSRRTTPLRIDTKNFDAHNPFADINRQHTNRNSMPQPAEEQEIPRNPAMPPAQRNHNTQPTTPVHTPKTAGNSGGLFISQGIDSGLTINLAQAKLPEHIHGFIQTEQTLQEIFGIGTSQHNRASPA